MSEPFLLRAGDRVIGRAGTPFTVASATAKTWWPVPDDAHGISSIHPGYQQTDCTHLWPDPTHIDLVIRWLLHERTPDGPAR